MMTFRVFFEEATRHPPYDWQERLARGPSEPVSSCRSLLINIPTGLGKTAGVVLAWLWNRLRPATPWPRRKMTLNGLIPCFQSTT
ncbi:MAG: hypothetical protein SNJ52_00480 [Verrucomicrobiia bacterium]